MNEIINKLAELLAEVDSGNEEFPVNVTTKFYQQHDFEYKGITLVPRVQSISVKNNNVTCPIRTVKFNLWMVLASNNPNGYEIIFDTLDDLSKKMVGWGERLPAGWTILTILLEASEIGSINLGKKCGLSLNTKFTLDQHLQPLI